VSRGNRGYNFSQGKKEGNTAGENAEKKMQEHTGRKREKQLQPGTQISQHLKGRQAKSTWGKTAAGLGEEGAKDKASV